MVSASMAFNVFLGAVAVVTAALMIRNLRSTGELPLPGLRKERGGGQGAELSVYVDGRRLVGVPYVAEELPREGQDLPLRLARLARSARVSVTFVSSMYSVRKSSVLKLLEEELRKTEFAYTATRHVKYRERLAELEDLYKDVMRVQVPYVGGFAFIVWVDPDDKDATLGAEAFKELVEAEANVRVRRARANELEALLTSSRPTWFSQDSWGPVVVGRDVINNETGVVIGEEVEGPGNLVILRWPDGFRVHLGAFGPTGRGKTVLLAGLASQLVSLSHTFGDPTAIVVVDPKGDLADMLRGVADSYITPSQGSCVPIRRVDGVAEKLVESARETGEGAEVPLCVGSGFSPAGLVVYDLRGLPNELRNVYGSLIVSSLALEASEMGLRGRVVLILDEAWRFAKGSAVHLEFALREGRSKGLYVIYATQLPTDVGRPIVDNTGYKLVFGGFTNTYVEMGAQLGLERPELLRSLPVGEALMVDEVGRARHVKVLDFSKPFKNLARLAGEGEGVRSDGEEPKAAEGRKGVIDLQEPRPRTPRPS